MVSNLIIYFLYFNTAENYQRETSDAFKNAKIK